MWGKWLNLKKNNLEQTEELILTMYTCCFCCFLFDVYVSRKNKADERDSRAGQVWQKYWRLNNIIRLGWVVSSQVRQRGEERTDWGGAQIVLRQTALTGVTRDWTRLDWQWRQAWGDWTVLSISCCWQGLARSLVSQSGQQGGCNRSVVWEERWAWRVVWRVSHYTCFLLSNINLSCLEFNTFTLFRCKILILFQDIRLG